jgi:large repetitive protein
MSAEPLFRLRPRTIARTAILTFSVAGLLALGGGQALASPVSCGDTITTDTKLDSDLTNCPGDGIVIGAPNITLDLNGHTIDGDETAGPACESFVEGDGVSNPDGHDGVTIKNGTIQEFTTGIRGGYGRSLMRDLTIRSNRLYGIIIGAGPGDNLDANEIERNLVTGNGCGGIGVFGASNERIELNQVTDTQAEGGMGISIDAVNNSLIARNTVSGNPAEAIGGGGNDGNSFTGNTISGNGGGIVLGSDGGNDGNTITGNTVSDNGDGIVLSGDSSNNVVKKNSATRNGAGVVIDSASHNKVNQNSLVANSFVGVLVFGGDDNQIKANSILRNGDGSEGGIHLVSNDQGDGSDRTVVSKNTLRANVGDGILVDPGQTATVIDGNRSDRNFDDGIDVDDPATTLSRNTANSNRDLGIEAVAGVTDGGGNKARGNRNPAQCTNVRCR